MFDDDKELKKENKSKEKKNKSSNNQKEPMDRQDLLCYIGAVFFLILAFVPIIMRNLDPTYDPNGRIDNKKPNTETKIRVNTLSCNKTFNEEGYSYYVEISSSYANGVISNTTITYKVTLDPAYSITIEDVIPQEYTTISEISSDGIGARVDNDLFTLNINYNLDQGLKDNELLDAHNKLFNFQRSNYEADGYLCVAE